MTGAGGGKLEKQVTHGPGGRILTNTAVWSPDSRWIVFDTRSDADGTFFDGTRIQAVNVETGEVRTLYTSKRGAHCGVATFHPRENTVVFILGPENPTPDWQYSPAHRQGVLVKMGRPEVVTNLDARDLVAPFTSGTLRGGSHVHVFSPDGEWVSFTYNDHVLPATRETGETGDIDQRNIGVSVWLDSGVTVPKSHPRNHDGAYFTILATRTVTNPAPGSDEIKRAFEEGWIGSTGYRDADGGWQKRALAFQGEVVTATGETISEVFVVDLPDDVTLPGSDGPLQGTTDYRPQPPRGTVQRRLTYTENQKHPGIQGPRHWLRSSPDGEQIAFLMKDDRGVVQLWTVSPIGGEPPPITRDVWSVASAFTWSPDGRHIAYVADNSVFIVDAATGISHRLTERVSNDAAPLPLACVYSPDGKHIAYLRRIPNENGETRSNQIFTVSL